MKASELIKKLQEMIEKHGDLDAVMYGDHDPISEVWFEEKSWVNDKKPAIAIGN